MDFKYKIADVAKEFGMPAKKVVETVSGVTGEAYKTAGTFEEKELNVLLETLTRENAEDSLDAYLASGKESVTPNTAAGLGVSMARSALVRGICSQATMPSQASFIWLTVRSLASEVSSTRATLPRSAFSCTRSYPCSSLPALRHSPSAPSSGC